MSAPANPDDVERWLEGLEVPAPDAGAPLEEHQRWMEERQEFVDGLTSLEFESLAPELRVRVKAAFERTLASDEIVLRALSARKTTLSEAFGELPQARDAARGYQRASSDARPSTRRRA
jgi:hypothetical protein